jgi:SAM-dependent methyltransferase
MAVKAKDNIYLISAALVLSASAVAALIAGKAPTPLIITAAAIATLIILRIARISVKERLRYINGPAMFCKGRGIEIGSGKNRMLKGSMLVDIVDDFSSDGPYRVDYVSDAHDLSKIESSSLDYVCASHVLEHLANPIKAILEWLRVLKKDGVIWLRIPDKRKTFDAPRRRTKLGHLIEDFEKDVPVDDPTHIDDNNRNTDPPRQQSHPYVHNHVWIPDDIIELFGYIRDKHASLSILDCKDNSCFAAQDFWIVIKKL